jgi:hypothetical protein
MEIQKEEMEIRTSERDPIVSKYISIVLRDVVVSQAGIAQR